MTSAVVHDGTWVTTALPGDSGWRGTGQLYTRPGSGWRRGAVNSTLDRIYVVVPDGRMLRYDETINHLVYPADLHADNGEAFPGTYLGGREPSRLLVGDFLPTAGAEKFEIAAVLRTHDKGDSSLIGVPEAELVEIPRAFVETGVIAVSITLEIPGSSAIVLAKKSSHKGQKIVLSGPNSLNFVFFETSRGPYQIDVRRSTIENGTTGRVFRLSKASTPTAVEVGKPFVFDGIDERGRSTRGTTGRVATATATFGHTRSFDTIARWHAHAHLETSVVHEFMELQSARTPRSGTIGNA